jgi:acetyltransferase-like isoleucine patch superfamily enzyme
MSALEYLPHDWFDRPLPSNVKIGLRSWLYSTFAFIHYLSRRPVGLCVGHDSGLYNGTFLDIGPEGEVTVGNYCTIVGAIIATNGQVEIGDYVFISHEVVIADHFAAVPPNSRHRWQEPAEEVRIVIEENAWIGARAVLLKGAHIGRGAIVGAAAVVDFEVPPYAVVAGNPARLIGNVR